MGPAPDDPAIDEAAVLERAAKHAHSWLESVPGRPAADVVDVLAAAVARAAHVTARQTTAVGE